MHDRPKHSAYVKENTRTNLGEHNALKINQLKTSLSFSLPFISSSLMVGHT